ncbi:MAG: 23S rRNA (pseudouridine(1915)-N(3))-methyltransferase RlmH [Slackia sp.]|nr:23S rRNA (pseudouridine(1915)-N(3))-methyltransferase RlmH [Slackia sp.]
MKIHIIAVGKLKEKFWGEACAEYMKRLKAYAKVTIEEIPDRDPGKCGGEEGARKIEGKGILEALPEHSHVILLDVGGKQLSSEGIAARMDALMLSGVSDITFVVGGSGGVSRSVQDFADECLSFGKITLPHNLARVVLLEQIYRAFKISRGEPYHK